MPGTVLLLAASPLGRGRLVDAAGVLPVLAAVAPAVLSGTDTANVVELADPLEPQAVLTRLRAAAAAPGPLTLYLTGQLHLDRRQHRLHLGLARTTPATVRYTALPWQWIREELRLRSAADTALVLDLHADPEAWRHLTERGLDCGPHTAVYGRVAPGAGRRGPAEPVYMKTVATLLRSGHRPALDVLHQQALSRVPEETRGNLLLAHAGGYAPGFSTAGGFVPVPVPGAGGPVEGLPPAPPVPPSSSGAGGPSGAPSPSAAAGTAAGTAMGVGTAAGAGAPGVGSSPAESVPGPRTEGLTRELRPASAPVEPASRVRPAESVPGPRFAGAAPGSRGADPHVAISDAVQGGRHGEADSVAARYEQEAVRAYGAGSEQALHWSEVRADLAMFAGDPVRSCRAWLAVAETRLGAGQAVDAPAVEAAVDRAHHQWARIKDTARARELGPALARLRLRVPGRRSGALENVQRQLGRLQAAQ
ncbi:hypothetical protein [Streptomyces echinatus]|uniref:Uncharacterized protein n=1 Tax=Streptomyces echinatus TaxID=67293 RepID=A0A7W9USN4_9ACTN|nr:hypothetical protein [Streptomyces echinatus]MBB5928769.1 hypothetical protein [Streptomyces echinatus]